MSQTDAENRTEVSRLSIETVNNSCLKFKICGVQLKRKYVVRSGLIVFLIFLTIFILLFVVFPLVLMNSIALQRLVIFTRFNLPDEREYFEDFELPGMENHYVTVTDLDGTSKLELGLWHLLPVGDTYKAFHDKSFNFSEALRHSDVGIVLYFHGTGETRSDSEAKYELLRHYFHVITFDYRSYGDSTQATLSERAVISDCVQIYEWLLERTNAPIYIWGHSLGAALATETISTLKQIRKTVPQALILEAPFTSMADEIYVHPFAKLYEIARNAGNSTNVVYHQFKYDLDYGHVGISLDPFLQYYIRDFKRDCTKCERIMLNV